MRACWGNSLWTAGLPESRQFLACSLVLMAELFQSQETRASRGEACPEDTAPIAKLASSFLRLLSAGRTWNSGLSFLLFGPNPLPGDPEPVRCPLGPSHLHINPCSHARSLVQSLSATSLHASWVHGPGPASRRGLGHWLQLLLRLPDVMELLELFHHVVFEVWV